MPDVVFFYFVVRFKKLDSVEQCIFFSVVPSTGSVGLAPTQSSFLTDDKVEKNDIRHADLGRTASRRAAKCAAADHVRGRSGLHIVGASG